jgi:HEAT repeat protein
MRTYFIVVWLSACLLASLCVRPPICRGDYDEVIDSPMYKNPSLPKPTVVFVVPEKTKNLWIKALGRPEADMRRMAADAIARAHRRGIKGLETTIDPLVAAMNQPDQRPTARLAMAQALIALDARDAAPALLRQSQFGDGDLRDLVEPTLARWDYQPARAVWIERLRDSESTLRGLLLAVRGLAAVQEGRAADRLLEITLSEESVTPLRLAAARALGSLRDNGLEKNAERLADDASPHGLVARMAAAALLGRHSGDDTVRVLQHLAGDAEPTVAVVAASRLVEINPDLVVPAVDRLLNSPDAGLRSVAVEVLFRRPTEQHIHLLADRLGDADLDVRQKARRSLEASAANRELHDPVLQETMRVLAGRQWQGQEQAAILLTRLDHKPAAKQLTALLSSNRPEVCITAAWGLRRLAVPETLPDVMKYVEATQKAVRSARRPPGPNEMPTEVLDHQLSQLNQFLGDVKYGPADSVLRQFLPRMEPPMRPVACPESRAAAVWALGRIHQGNPEAALATALEGRLNDTASQPPEDDRVRSMCAIALGRMKAMASLPSLRMGFPSHEPSFDSVNNACGWAIEQCTGETVPAPGTIEKVANDWFLVPND